MHRVSGTTKHGNQNQRHYADGWLTHWRECRRNQAFDASSLCVPTTMPMLVLLLLLQTMVITVTVKVTLSSSRQEYIDLRISCREKHCLERQRSCNQHLKNRSISWMENGRLHGQWRSLDKRVGWEHIQEHIQRVYNWRMTRYTRISDVYISTKIKDLRITHAPGYPWHNPRAQKLS